MKKISTIRITVITSPEDSSEFQREGKSRQVRYKIAARSLVLLFYPIGRKKSSFRSGGMSPLYFSRNSPKGHTAEERGTQKKEKRERFFLPCAGNPQTRGLNLPLRSLSFSFARAITLSFSHSFSSHTGPVSFVLWS